MFGVFLIWKLFVAALAGDDGGGAGRAVPAGGTAPAGRTAPTGGAAPAGGAYPAVLALVTNGVVALLELNRARTKIETMQDCIRHSKESVRVAFPNESYTFENQVFHSAVGGTRNLIVLSVLTTLLICARCNHYRRAKI